jgi:hypothetical protein
MEQQRELNQERYRYQPRDPVVQKQYQERYQPRDQGRDQQRDRDHQQRR